MAHFAAAGPACCLLLALQKRLYKSQVSEPTRNAQEHGRHRHGGRRVDVKMYGSRAVRVKSRSFS